MWMEVENYLAYYKYYSHNKFNNTGPMSKAKCTDGSFWSTKWGLDKMSCRQNDMATWVDQMTVDQMFFDKMAFDQTTKKTLK